LCADGNGPDIADGITGVGDEVHDDLLDLVRIGHDSYIICAEICFQFDAFIDEPAEKALGPADQVVQPDRFHLRILFAGESENAVGELCPTVRNVQYLFHIPPGRAFGWKLGHQEVPIADDCGQNVVEVMGHAACQQPNGFHFLGVEQLVLQFPSLGEVIEGGQVDIGYYGIHYRYLSGRSIPANYPCFDRIDLHFLRTGDLAGSLPRLQHRAAYHDIGIGPHKPCIYCRHVLQPIAEDFTEPSVDEEDVAFHVRKDNCRGGRVEQHVELCLELEQGFFEFFPLFGLPGQILAQPVNFCGLLSQLAEQGFAVVLVEFPFFHVPGCRLVRGRAELQDFFNDPLQFFRFLGFDDEAVGAQAQGKSLIFWLGVCRGVKYEGHVPQDGVCLAVPAQAVAVHDRHENVGHDQIGRVPPGHFQRFGAVHGGHDFVIDPFQERFQQVAVLKDVVNDQDTLHALPFPSVYRPRNFSICDMKVSGFMGFSI